jgi:hypothetical protein
MILKILLNSTQIDYLAAITETVAISANKSRPTDNLPLGNMVGTKLMDENSNSLEMLPTPFERPDQSFFDCFACYQVSLPATAPDRLEALGFMDHTQRKGEPRRFVGLTFQAVDSTRAYSLTSSKTSSRFSAKSQKPQKSERDLYGK